MAKKKAPKFPEQLFVKIGGIDDADKYFDADVTADAADDGEEVAIYQFVEVKRKRVTHELE